MRSLEYRNGCRSSAAAAYHRGAAWVVASLFVLASYRAPLYALSPAPGADFVAHVEHRGLVIDRAPGAAPAVLVPAGSLFSRGPDYLLEADGTTLAALWVKDLAHVTVRRTADPASPVIGRVQASWQDGAMRLTLQPADGPTLQTGRFHRVDGPGLPDLLTADFRTVLDERGMYRADLRDEHGKTTGWLSVRISPYQESRRVYDAALPSGVADPLAAAAVALVNANLRESERHAVDVYLGN